MTPELKPYEGSDKYIYLICSPKDREAGRELVRELNGAGFRVKYSEETASSEGWPETAARDLTESDACIAVVSPNLLGSVETVRQITFSQSKNKPLVSVFTEPAELSPGMQMLLLANRTLYRYELDDCAFIAALLDIKCLEASREAAFAENIESSSADVDGDNASAEADVESAIGAGVALALGGGTKTAALTSALANSGKPRFFTASRVKKAASVTLSAALLAVSLAFVYLLLGRANNFLFDRGIDPGSRVLAMANETEAPASDPTAGPDETSDPTDAPTPTPYGGAPEELDFTGLTLSNARRLADKHGIILEIPEWYIVSEENPDYRVYSQEAAPGELLSPGDTVTLLLSTNIFMTVPRINSSSVELFNGHGYAVFKGKFTWCEAEMLCELMGGHLATVNDFDEQQFLCSINGNRDSLWLGGYRYYFDPDSWRWVTGEPWDFTNWGDDEPNGGNNPGDECCCVLWPVLWNDLSDSNLHEQSGFICEWEPGELPE